MEVRIRNRRDLVLLIAINAQIWLVILHGILLSYLLLVRLMKVRFSRCFAKESCVLSLCAEFTMVGTISFPGSSLSAGPETSKASQTYGKISLERLNGYLAARILYYIILYSCIIYKKRATMTRLPLS